jgi:predicted nuclease of predicted toxin-antitoxin system
VGPIQSSEVGPDRSSELNDVMVMQTAIIGEADILCTKDDDFFEDSAANT